MLMLQKYDGIATVSLDPRLAPISIYQGLNYTSFAINQSGLTAMLGEIIPSGVLPSSLPDDLISGTKQRGSDGQQATISIQGTDTREFDLISRRPSCATLTKSGIPDQRLACLLNTDTFTNVEDTKHYGRISQTPKGGMPLTKIVTSEKTASYKCLGIQRLEIDVFAKDKKPEVIVIVLDDLDYVVRTWKLMDVDAKDGSDFSEKRHKRRIQEGDDTAVQRQMMTV